MRERELQLRRPTLEVATSRHEVEHKEPYMATPFEREERLPVLRIRVEHPLPAWLLLRRS